ncbi:hypothetical protein C8J57DRAFT_1576160 [Mycena rebaudengoi]|nr:hypothetical protein C8J57DRAFT_1576160 [Mycena rebaudengoi]
MLHRLKSLFGLTSTSADASNPPPLPARPGPPPIPGNRPVFVAPSNPARTSYPPVYRSTPDVAQSNIAPFLQIRWPMDPFLPLLNRIYLPFFNLPVYGSTPAVAQSNITLFVWAGFQRRAAKENWTMVKYEESAKKFYADHSIFDPDLRPPTFERIRASENEPSQTISVDEPKRNSHKRKKCRNSITERNQTSKNLIGHGGTRC